ncbi:multidrug effflux MFS transporter [Paenibacillus sp.]|uniref:multidrug effflux MFS transporter n=1 Tax=Paenibacillus sp. TaxID=58172 RepID=UPI002D48683F|nr:multidrug effflux MFS transporter [Paenibacillus sp.]HZG85527.1 multidrug effflux MFS transporter [Paenibacillus sp.]
MDHKANNHPLRLALLLAVFSALGPFTVDMYLASFPQMMTFFDTTASMIQASLMACLLGLGLGQLVFGPLSDIHGRRKPLLFSMMLYLLSSLCCTVAPNIEIFIALRIVQGFAASAGLVISRAIVRDMYNGVELTKFFALLTMISSAAPLLSPLAGSTVITFTSWEGVFIFLGLLGICLTAITTWGLKESLPVEQRVPNNFMELLGNYKTLIRNRIFMGYALVKGFLFAGVFAYVSGTPFIYQNIYGVSPQVFSMLFAMNGISIMIGSQLVKQLAGRISERHILLIGLVLAFITSVSVLCVVLYQGPFFALIIPLFFFTTSIGIVGPVAFTLGMELQGHIAGGASAILGILPFLLGAIASPLVGLAGEYSAVPLGVILITTSLLSIIIYVTMTKKVKSEPAAQFRDVRST